MLSSEGGLWNAFGFVRKQIRFVEGFLFVVPPEACLFLWVCQAVEDVESIQCFVMVLLGGVLALVTRPC